MILIENGVKISEHYLNYKTKHFFQIKFTTKKKPRPLENETRAPYPINKRIIRISNRRSYAFFI